MKEFNLKKYLAESKLLKEGIDPNSEIADYVRGMFNSSVYDYEGIQSDVWSKAEYAATSPGEGSVFMDLVDYLKSVGGKDILEGNPDIYLELLPNEDIQWKAEIILNPQDDLRYLQENRLEGLIREKLCKKGQEYRKRRMAAGEKSSAYLSGRAVKVCKGQMSGKSKKK